MFALSDEKLKEMKAYHTVREIQQQTDIWKEAYELYLNKEEAIHQFIQNLKDIYGKVRVIFTGAGTSAYVGDVLKKYVSQDIYFTFESIATTDLVSCPKSHFSDVPTLLVSFARSGNSPESLQAVKLANKLLKNVHHLAITCAKEGKLAQNLKNDYSSYVMLMPERSNDAGFAMTSSFTCMLLSALLIFDKKHTREEKKQLVDKISYMAGQVVNREKEVESILEGDFDRIVYLGSGVFEALTREAQLKILELTAGRIVTCYDSSMGFRHGPKSFIDEKTLVVDFISTNGYTRLYDVDIVEEIFQDGIAKKVVAVSVDELEGAFPQFSFNMDKGIEDVYVALGYIVLAQTIAVLASIKVKNQPDTPSATGTVNRVVKGVTIHEL